MSLLWGLLGYALGHESGRDEGLQEAKRRIDGGNPNDGRPRIHRKQGGPPPPPPTKWQWIGALFLGALIFAAARMIDDVIFGPDGNATIPETTFDGMVSFVRVILSLFQFFLYLSSLVPLSLVTTQWLDSRQDDGPQGANFKFSDRRND